MVDENYKALRDVFEAAIHQAADGKGKTRHAGEYEAFEDQQICQIPRWLGSIDGPLFQAVKKCLEVNRISTTEAKIHELLGALNYIAAAIIVLKGAEAPALLVFPEDTTKTPFAVAYEKELRDRSVPKTSFTKVDTA
ncbi:MAG: hypothetical protein EHM66_00545 [Deltaproteobacteria bacterium]|nr:MAG: hypothetical protein EHM66_00545 [Deltaproteobacteria bacterium]